jgi:hypothetical protein
LASELGWKNIWASAEQSYWATPIQEPLPMPKGPWPLLKSAPPQGAWSQALIDSDNDALQRLGFSATEIDATLKSPHGGSRKGKGGETAARQRFAAWMAQTPEPTKTDPNFVSLGKEYGAAGADYLKDGEVDAFQWKNLSTSAGWIALSKHMACGCISAREMYHMLLRVNHWALPGLVHRLMWREWHRINALKYQTHLFRLSGPGHQIQFPRAGGSPFAQRWKHGQTGVPYIDACMRELNQTGWIPYHKRKTVACFLCHDLQVDWRFGGFHFEEVLLDYDVAMNYGNWTFCARVDKPYGDRYTAAAHRDPEHWAVFKSIQAAANNEPDYIRGWVPELKNVPKELLQCPWKMTNAQMREASCQIGKDYPEPLVQFPDVEDEAVPPSAIWSTLAKTPGLATLEKFGKFPGVGFLFLCIVYMTGSINNPNNLGKQLCIVCSHNIAIGYLFDKEPDGIYVGFPHFGPFSVDTPVLRILARFWSYEMVAVRFATALRPLFIPGLFASFASLIIPQMAVFAPWQLGGVMASDYFKNPISFASVNGFPALIWLIYFLTRQLLAMPATSLVDLTSMWVDIPGERIVDIAAILLGVLPFLCTAIYKVISRFTYWTPPSKFPANGKTFFGLMNIFAPCYLYLLYKGWELNDVHKVVYAFASFMPVWWVNCLGGVDLWIEEPLGMPARDIAFTPTWIVSHGVFFLQWALEPADYINRLVFLTYMCPQLVYLNFYFRKACCQDWGTQLPIYYSYVMFAHMTVMELYKGWLDIQNVGISAIATEVMKDCPLHFTTAQFTVFMMVLAALYLAPNSRYRWALYSLCGPLNWFGLL